jgi:hypothetical protein
MLHYAFSAFEDVVLHDEETNPVWSPTTASSLRMAVADRLRGRRTVYVTKRDYGWYTDRKLRMVAHDIQNGQVGLVNIVRDPRDALTSTHANEKGRSYYLEPGRWMASVDAAERLFKALADHRRKVTIRYEDVVLKPDTVQEVIEREMGVRLRNGLSSWANLADNLAGLSQSVGMEKALHAVRNFDPSSIGRWKAGREKVAYWSSLSRDPELSTSLRGFMEMYGYSDE